MKAIVTSIGETTRELCVWSLQRNGFDVKVVESGNTLAEKLKFIYNNVDEDFVRVDADVVPNNRLTPDAVKSEYPDHCWWWQFQTFDWHQQDFTWGGVQFIKKEALPDLRANIDQFMNDVRPETRLTRITEFHNPRRFESVPVIYGLHGFGAKDVERVRQMKELRNQSETYDWELADKLLELIR